MKNISLARLKKLVFGARTEKTEAVLSGVVPDAASPSAGEGGASAASPPAAVVSTPQGTEAASRRAIGAVVPESAAPPASRSPPPPRRFFAPRTPADAALLLHMALQKSAPATPIVGTASWSMAARALRVRADQPVPGSPPLIVGRQPHCLVAAGQDLPVACVVVSGSPGRQFYFGRTS